MKEMGQFNTELKLFKETLPPVKIATLEFMHWLAKKQGKVHSAPCGEFALAAEIMKAPSEGQNNGKMDTKE